jgi:glycosyltransferase involved in cell wall biosynthesis
MNNSSCDVTLVICTRNRNAYLKLCLKAIEKIENSNSEFKVLIIDNGSTDGSLPLIKQFCENNDKHQFEIEPKVGLSHARNRALTLCRSKWIAFIDDDVIISEDYFKRTCTVINHFNFDLFGGKIKPKYLSQPPKWIPENLNVHHVNLDETGVLYEGYITAANMIVKRNVLFKIGGFPTDLGMKGDKIGYGEEDYIQQELRKNGYTIGFDPILEVEHLILPHKLKLFWHIKSIFHHGKANAEIHLAETRVQLIYFVTRSLVACIFYKFPRNSIKCFMHEKYYIQNVVIDSLYFPVYNLGKLISTWSKKH